jgi:hypothetical protein
VRLGDLGARSPKRGNQAVEVVDLQGKVLSLVGRCRPREQVDLLLTTVEPGAVVAKSSTLKWCRTQAADPATGVGRGQGADQRARLLGAIFEPSRPLQNRAAD